MQPAEERMPGPAEPDGAELAAFLDQVTKEEGLTEPDPDDADIDDEESDVDTGGEA